MRLYISYNIEWPWEDISTFGLNIRDSPDSVMAIQTYRFRILAGFQVNFIAHRQT